MPDAREDMAAPGRGIRVAELAEFAVSIPAPVVDAVSIARDCAIQEGCFTEARNTDGSMPSFGKPGC